MKKEIMQLVSSNEGQIRLNSISYLRRWTKTAIGTPVDKLELVFDSINNVRFSIYDTEIKSRDYNGIIKECEELTSRFLAEVSRSLCNDLRAGHK